MTKIEARAAFEFQIKVLPVHELFKAHRGLGDNQNVSGKSFVKKISGGFYKLKKKKFVRFRLQREKLFRWKFACLYIVVIMQSLKWLNSQIESEVVCANKTAES